MHETQDEQGVDEDLMSLARRRQQGSVLQPILNLLVIAVLFSVVNDWRSEIAYFFESSEPVALGEVTAWPSKHRENPEWAPPVEHNSFVSLEGVPSRRSEGGDWEFFKLVGGDIYVQREGRLAGLSALEKEVATDEAGDNDRTYYEGQGRLLSFASSGERLAGLKRFYGERYGEHFCEDYDQAGLDELAERRREVITRNWTERYRQASAEEREAKGWTEYPTAAEVQEVFESQPLCVNAYFVQSGTRPVDHWWYVVMAALMGLFGAYNAYRVVRWARGWVQG
ncbi:hypothetical protein DL240_14080 [Lujinxingia litoralis]|uniref:Uncharacterized protein n=1 Tax=Lujinxingia litoralis TaxID=2211119 RepID=A0A328C570_9DELT|nr:hypothetical protein [Lujinxingia litoralis]RAL21250.1 hypothetical protein DL240_14080 [Lujinxingia litoralis]